MNKVKCIFASFILLTAISGCSSIISASTDGPIEENSGTRSWGSIIDDQSIETTAKVNISKASPELASSHITVASYNGIVLLVGQVSNQNLKSMAEQTIKSLSKVRTVYNELTVSGPTSLPARSHDSWITTKAKSKLLATEGIPSNRIKVITENGVIYMMGLLTKDEAQNSANVVATTYGAQRVVQVFEYID